MKIVKRVLLALFGIVFIAVVGFYVWTRFARYEATPNATRVAAQATKTTQNWLVFESRAVIPTTGLIIYPGGLVDYAAYSPLAEAIAQRGYLVVIVPMPLELALFDSNAADAVMRAFPKLARWVVAGHSLGGSAASQFVLNNPGRAAGLVFWASYPISTMGSAPIQMLSIYGTRDGVLRRTGQALLEGTVAGTNLIAIEGGNHAMFGSYGAQKGDNAAALSDDVTRELIVNGTVNFMKNLL